MICNQCGQVNHKSERACSYCGADLRKQARSARASHRQPNYRQPNDQPPSYAHPTYQPPNAEPYNSPPRNQKHAALPVLSLVMGILAIVSVSWLWGVLAVCLGGAAQKRGCGDGKAKAGVICGVIGILLNVFMLTVSILIAIG